MQKLRYPAIHKEDALRQNRRLPMYETAKDQFHQVRKDEIDPFCLKCIACLLYRT